MTTTEGAAMGLDDLSKSDPAPVMGGQGRRAPDIEGAAVIVFWCLALGGILVALLYAAWRLGGAS